MAPIFYLKAFLLATFASTAMCGSLGQHKDDPKETEVAGITQALFDQLQLIVQYCAATYYPSNVNSTGDRLSCHRDHCKHVPKDNCPRVEEAEAFTSNEFMDTLNGDDHGYVAIDPRNQLVVLAFRGTDSAENWKNNLDMRKMKTDFCDECNVHKGFWDQYVEMRGEYIRQVQKAHEKYPKHRMIVTGHSLGAALATLAAADIRKIDEWFLENTELYTYGSPRIGNEETARFLTSQSKHSYRVTSMKDIVPRLPPVHLGYWHTQPEYWIHAHPDEPSPENITVLTGYNNDNGNRDTHGINFEPHRHYFGLIRGC